MNTWRKIVEASKRNDFKITFEDGNTITTGFNGTLEDAKNYYKIGKPFNVGDGPNDKMVKVTKVEQINESVELTEEYKDSNPKIDLFVDGKYMGSTKWSKTLKQAITAFETAYPELKGKGKVKASFDK